MVRAIKVTLQDGEKIRRILQKNGWYNNRFLVKKEEGVIYFPVVPDLDIRKNKIKGKKEGLDWELVDVELEKHEDKMNTSAIEQALAFILTVKERELLPRSYDVIGDILVLELPDELQKKEKKIAEAYLATHKQVKTVVKKARAHGGVYRTRGIEILLGEKRKETIHRESGLRLKIHLEKVYFSPRSVGERLRIARQVKKGEEVLVMFSGAAPFCCVIAKHSPAKQVVGIEINPAGHRYGEENVQLNKLQGRVKLYCGDVRKVLPRLKKNFDRIVMPLPKTSSEFLPLALKYVKKGGIIHYYCFLEDGLIETEGFTTIKEICMKEKKKCRILRWCASGQQAPRIWRVCFDVKIL